MRDPRLADRVRDLPPYPFEEIDRKKAAARAAGVDVVDLGIGDPDLPTLDHIVARMIEAVREPALHRYPSYRGSERFRGAVAAYLQRRFSVDVDPTDEVLALIGTKEGIAHLALALLNPGDWVLVPEPAYPVYASSARFVGATPWVMPLTRDNDFLPRLDEIPADVAKKAKLIWINYPNNPLGAVAPRSFFEEVAAFAAEHDLVVAHDAAYAEIYLDDQPPLSALEVPALRDRLVEFHSLSKTFNMTGWRVGFAAGAAWVVEALGTIKTNVDSGVFGAIQEAAITALQGPWEPVAALRRHYGERRDRLVAGLRAAGLDWVETPATFYVVVAVPQKHTSLSFATFLLEEAGLVCTPCTAFGAAGEGYVRFSLTAADDRIDTAARRLSALKEA